MMPEQFSCPTPGCDYTAKTQGAITQHVNKQHGHDPLASVRNSIGQDAPKPGAALHERQIKAAPSGVPSVDYAIGIGGVPRGTIIEVFGPPASGKTFMALTFSAHAQQIGQRAGYMDAERALQPSFTQLVPGLDLEALEYGQPPGKFGETDAPFDGTGEAALEASRRFIKSGEFAIWTIDSVHACKPREAMRRPIGDPASMAALAKLFNDALGIIEPELTNTNCVLVCVNHVKAKPGVQFGRDWSKPGGSAFDYYAAIQLEVTVGTQYFNKASRRIGHEVRVKVYKSKVAAPHAKASYDLFYAQDRVIPKSNQKDLKARDVIPGVDIPSSYLSVLRETSHIVGPSNRLMHASTGELLGAYEDVRDMLDDPSSELYAEAKKIVYPEQYVSV